MIKADDAWYLYIQYGMEDPTPYISCFRFDKGELTYITETGAFYTFPSNPEHCVFTKRSDLLGTGYVQIPASIIGNKGVPTQNGDFVSKKGMGVAKETMVLGMFEDGKPTSDSIQIEKGTVVRLIGIDTKNGLVKLAAMYEGVAEDVVFYMVCRSSDYEQYDVYFDGKRAYDLFDGCRYAD